ncbi:hypothetical protein TcCL_ESM09190 [Trypanosoma cruzi]|nr:hypothetical protein TcCL_ESM09190 [Trypanosoma cruzi]
MRNRAAPFPSASSLRLCSADHVATADTAVDIAAAHAHTRHAAHKRAAPALLEELSARFGMSQRAPLDSVRWRLWLPLATLRSALLEVPAWSWDGGRATADTVTSTRRVHSNFLGQWQCGWNDHNDRTAGTLVVEFPERTAVKEGPST